MGAMQKGSRETGGPDTLNALESLVFIVGVLPSCPRSPCPFSLAPGIVIGVADSCLPGCLQWPPRAPPPLPVAAQLHSTIVPVGPFS